MKKTLRILLASLALCASTAAAYQAPTFYTYLPNCADCTWTTPCDTECGYDPGKGGPVTCGEYGVCLGWP